MACGNNMVSRSALQSAPTPLSIPAAPSLARVRADERHAASAQQQIRSVLSAAERQVSSAQSQPAAAQAVKDAQRAVDAARRLKDVPARVRGDLVREAERQLASVKRSAAQVESAADSESDRRQRLSQERAEWDRLSQMSLGVANRSVAPMQQAAPPASKPNVVSPTRPPQWVADYLQQSGAARDVREIEVDGFTYLYDTTTSPARSEPDNRIIAVYGRSGGSHGERDKSRMAGFPNPNHVDRGHLVARLAGGGYDLNLVPQDPSLNRGHSEPGKVWRELEIYLADNPGTAFFVRPTYRDDSDYPSRFEFGVQSESGQWRIEAFDNRPE